LSSVFFKIARLSMAATCAHPDFYNLLFLYRFFRENCGKAHHWKGDGLDSDRKLRGAVSR
jgi:hypothetical protein